MKIRFNLPVKAVLQCRCDSEGRRFGWVVINLTRNNNGQSSAKWPEESLSPDTVYVSGEWVRQCGTRVAFSAICLTAVNVNLVLPYANDAHSLSDIVPESQSVSLGALVWQRKPPGRNQIWFVPSYSSVATFSFFHTCTQRPLGWLLLLIWANDSNNSSCSCTRPQVKGRKKDDCHYHYRLLSPSCHLCIVSYSAHLPLNDRLLLLLAPLSLLMLRETTIQRLLCTREDNAETAICSVNEHTLRHHRKQVPLLSALLQPIQHPSSSAIVVG